jgi:hypothetical protein
MKCAICRHGETSMQHKNNSYSSLQERGFDRQRRVRNVVFNVVISFRKQSFVKSHIQQSIW